MCRIVRADIRVNAKVLKSTQNDQPLSNVLFWNKGLIFVKGPSAVWWITSSSLTALFHPLLMF